MIYDQLKNADLYEKLGEPIKTALEFLAKTDLTELPNGRHEIDGDNVYAMLMSYETKRPEKALLEAHDCYIDVQCMIDGEEQFQVGFRDQMAATLEQRPTDDISFFSGPSQPLKLSQGQFLIFFPEDIHAPGICINEPTTVRKVVVKVKA